jgi:hypothetical protein
MTIQSFGWAPVIVLNFPSPAKIPMLRNSSSKESLEGNDYGTMIVKSRQLV